MNKHMTGTVESQAKHRFALKTGVAMLAAAGLMSAFPAVAQDAAPAATVVTVTGVRKAAESAQKIKMDADNVIDSIVADDIGKFPDTNVAETLARVAGIQVRRDAGEANTVLIRGLPFISTFINGREMFTTTGRYIQLADIPSTMLQRADVYKSQSAEMIEGGIAGAIDVRTNRPFDFKGFQVSAQGGAKNTDKANATDPEASGMISNRWKTGAGEFGALFGVSYVKNHFHEERGFETFPIDKSFAAPNLTGPDLVGIQDIYGQRKRIAENFALQWKPSADVELYAEGLHSSLKSRDETDFFVGLPWATSPDQIKVTKIPGTNQTDTIDSTNAFTILSTQARAAESIASQYAIGGKWRVAPGLRTSAEVSRTTSSFDWVNPILDTNLNVDKVHIKTNVDDGAFAQYQGAALNDPGKIFLFQFFDRYGHDRGRSTDWRADGTYTPESDGLFKEFNFGVRGNERRAESIKSLEGSVSAIPGVTMGSVPGLSCTTQPFSVNYGTPKWSTPCANFMIDQTGVVRKAVTGNAAAKALDPASFFQDKEKNLAFYGKAKIGFDMAGIPVDGVFGVRVTKTDEDLLANNNIVTSNGLVYVPVSKSTSNTDVLPSANIKLTLRRDLLARLAYAKTLTRPDFSALNPATAYVNSNGTTTLATASGGNPDLKPVTAQNFDGTLEWYFASTGYVSGTLFRHNFDGYIMGKGVQETFQGVNYLTTRPFNTDKGHLQGLELAYQQFYDGLPGWLSGFGLQANVTFSQGGATSSAVPGLEDKPFAGMSKLSYNIVGLYEKQGWSARLAYNWRSKFTQLYGDTPDPAHLPGKDLIAGAMSTLDGSLSYKITPQLSVNLTGTNLLNFKYQDYWQDPTIYPRDTRRYDRTVGLSLSWKN
ncbi:TonB-dependent receptor [Duganella vulcania]|uniref:TonB-dependent receptor n=1 Tax=Duganella vulcania TaxID=2692166 RepID=A0A845GHN2_9BURK|nr:TonB-dependent receptor [Duganella vulcania]MYM94093.1 TonB-dependent receptor [Duganella vulcania]